MLGPNDVEILAVEENLPALREQLIAFSCKFKGEGSEECKQIVEDAIKSVTKLHDFCQRFRISIQAHQPTKPRPPLDAMGVQATVV